MSVKARHCARAKSAEGLRGGSGIIRRKARPALVRNSSTRRPFTNAKPATIPKTFSTASRLFSPARHYMRRWVRSQKLF